MQHERTQHSLTHLLLTSSSEEIVIKHLGPLLRLVKERVHSKIVWPVILHILKTSTSLNKHCFYTCDLSNYTHRTQICMSGMKFLNPTFWLRILIRFGQFFSKSTRRADRCHEVRHRPITRGLAGCVLPPVPGYLVSVLDRPIGQSFEFLSGWKRLKVGS